MRRKRKKPTEAVEPIIPPPSQRLSVPTLLPLEQLSSSDLFTTVPHHDQPQDVPPSEITVLDEDSWLPAGEPEFKFNPEDIRYLDSFPPGYRFRPTDIELLLNYLKPKVASNPLPKNKIVEINIYKHSPEELADTYKKYGEKEWYFFTPRDRKYTNGGRPNRKAADGYWKATGADKVMELEGSTIGYRKSLVFHIGKPPKGEGTRWIMHEYRLNEGPTHTRVDLNDMRLDDWILCRIYKRPESEENKKKKRKKSRKQDDQKEASAVVHGQDNGSTFTMGHANPHSSNPPPPPPQPQVQSTAHLVQPPSMPAHLPSTPSHLAQSPSTPALQAQQQWRPALQAQHQWTASQAQHQWRPAPQAQQQWIAAPQAQTECNFAFPNLNDQSQMTRLMQPNQLAVLSAPRHSCLPNPELQQQYYDQRRQSGPPMINNQWAGSPHNQIWDVSATNFRNDAPMRNLMVETPRSGASQNRMQGFADGNHAPGNVQDGTQGVTNIRNGAPRPTLWNFGNSQDQMACFTNFQGGASRPMIERSETMQDLQNDIMNSIGGESRYMIENPNFVNSNNFSPATSFEIRDSSLARASQDPELPDDTNPEPKRDGFGMMFTYFGNVELGAMVGDSVPGESWNEKEASSDEAKSFRT